MVRNPLFVTSVFKHFLEQFQAQSIISLDDVLVIKEFYFLVTKKQREIFSHARHKPVFIGNCLGRKKGNTFCPSVNLLDLLSKHYPKHIILDPKTEWLFICGRDIFSTTHVQGNPQDNEPVLVMNQFKECIGIAQYISAPSKKNPIKRVYDIGDYLRRERTRKI